MLTQRVWKQLKHKQTVVWWVAEVRARPNNTSGTKARSKVGWTVGRVGAQVLKSTIMSSTGARLTRSHSPAPSSDRPRGWSEVPRPCCCSSQWEVLLLIGSGQFGIPGEIMDSLGFWRLPLNGYWRWLDWDVYNDGFILVPGIFNYDVLTKFLCKDKATLSDVIIT